MKPTRTNKLYNYLVNTYGLSKELILDHVDTRISDLIDKHVKSKMDSASIENMILGRVTQYLKNGHFDRWNDKHSFDNHVHNCIKEEVAKLVKQNYDISASVKIELKDVSRS